MTERENQLDSGTNSAAASDASTEPKPLPNAAAASDVKSAPPVPINPDDLHDLFQGSPSGLDDEDPLAQLRNDPNYAALLRDLQYIAEAARELFATEEEAPSDEVWSNIQKKLGTDPPDISE